MKPRTLRDLSIREVSGVTKGAGIGTRIMLRKMEDAVTDIAKVQKQTVDLFKVDLARSHAETKVAAAARDAFKRLSAADVLRKMGGGSLPQRDKTHDPEVGGRRTSEAHDRGHSGRDVQNPHEPYHETRTDVGRDGASDPAHRRHAKRFADGVMEKVRGGMTHSRAIDAQMREDPDGWQAHKAMPAHEMQQPERTLGRDRDHGRSGAMLPPSHDGNAGRP
jgi:hypothetical protein